MRKENLSSDEIKVLNITGEIRTLTLKKTNLTVETDNLDKNLSKMKEEQMGHEEKAKETIYSAKQEAERIMKSASELYKKSEDREALYSKRIGEVKNKEEDAMVSMKKADDLIKSNEGLKKNLKIDSDILKTKLEKVNQFLEDTTNALKTI